MSGVTDEYPSLQDPARKKVHFAEPEEKTPGEKSPTPEPASKTTKEEEVCLGKVLRIRPANELLFEYDMERATTTSLLLTNVGTMHVAYKVKTTAPTKYRVRPSLGTVGPGGTVEILVNLLPGFARQTLAHDKFLVQATELTDDEAAGSRGCNGYSKDDLGEVWNGRPKDDVMEHKIRCGISSEWPPNDRGDVASEIALLSARVDSLVSSTVALRGEVGSLRLTIYAVVLLHVVLVFAAILLAHLELLPIGTSTYVINSCLKETL